MLVHLHYDGVSHFNVPLNFYSPSYDQVSLGFCCVLVLDLENLQSTQCCHRNAFADSNSGFSGYDGGLILIGYKGILTCVADAVPDKSSGINV